MPILLASLAVSRRIYWTAEFPSQPPAAGHQSMLHRCAPRRISGTRPVGPSRACESVPCQHPYATDAVDDPFTGGSSRARSHTHTVIPSAPVAMAMRFQTVFRLGGREILMNLLVLFTDHHCFP